MGDVSDNKENSLLSKFRKSMSSIITPSNSPTQQGSSQKHDISIRRSREVKMDDSQGSSATDDDEILIKQAGGKNEANSEAGTDD